MMDWWLLAATFAGGMCFGIGVTVSITKPRPQGLSDDKQGGT